MGNSLTAFKFGTAAARGLARESKVQEQEAAERNKSRSQRAQERAAQVAQEDFDLEKELGKNPELLNSILGIRTGEVDSQGRPISQSEDIKPKKKKTNTVSTNTRPSVLSLAGLNGRRRRSILGTPEEESIIGG